jgi:hypothetical protein
VIDDGSWHGLFALLPLQAQKLYDDLPPLRFRAKSLSSPNLHELLDLLIMENAETSTRVRLDRHDYEHWSRGQVVRKKAASPEKPAAKKRGRDPEDQVVDPANSKTKREKMLDKTIADSFPVSDAPSSLPNPSEDSFSE